MTTKINLLPWRAQLREEQKKQFLFMIMGGVITAAIFIAIVFLAVGNKIKREEQVNTYIESETRILDQQLAEIQEIKEQREELIARRRVLQQLQIERVAVVALLQSLVKELPDGIFLTEIKKEGDNLSLSGKAESNTRVSELMQRVEASPWITDPLLTEIKADAADNARIRSFQIRMTEHLPPVTALQKEPTDGSQ